MSELENAKTNPRGRPPLSEEQMAQMRTKIAGAARGLFQEDGYEAISMRRLAKEVGCTPMSIYTYFDSKVDVLRALWADVFEDLFAKVNASAPAITSPTERLHAMCLAYVEFWLDQRSSYRMVFMSAGIEQSEVSVFVEASPVASHYTVFFSALADAADRPLGEVIAATQTLICGMNGIAHSLITISGYPWDSPQKLVANLVEGAVLNASASQ
jgi:AcrR family transcriptional regulator